MPDVLGEIVSDVGESAKAMGFVVEALYFEHACV